MQTIFTCGQTLQMEIQKFDLNSLEVLAQANSIVSQAAEDITVETRIEKRLEITQLIRSAQEQVSLLDRIRNTDGQITLCLNCANYPTVSGEIRFTSDEFLVIDQSQAQFLVRLSQIEYIFGAENKGIYRNANNSVDTTLLWLKNLIDSNHHVSVHLISGKTFTGQIVRLNSDHFDLVVNQNRYLIPLVAIALIRSNNETR